MLSFQDVGEEIPQFHCDQEDQDGLRSCMFCPDRWEPDELTACVECGRVVCPHCRVEMDYGFYCMDCSICRVCGRPALMACASCETLVCSEHVVAREVYEDRPVGHESFMEEGCVKCLGRRTDVS